ncbi:MAG TPA: DUF2269 family protein [candidate division Zixibacteria bacterium]|nr:DUF2269 family protein [candidate division Zixibacteria bacterium]
MDFYPWMKTLHVLLAILAMGSNATYGIWQARAARNPEHMGWTLRTVKFIDDRVANPSYIGLAIFGVLMVLTGPWEFEMFWIAVAIGLYLLLMVLGLAVYTPLLSRQIRVFETDGPHSPEFAQLTRRSRMLGGLLGLIVIAIVVLMVVKPGA